jgi:hypothetical protein
MRNSVILGLILSAGATAFATTAFVQTVFGKAASVVAWNSAEISLATLASTAAFSRPFLQASSERKSLQRRLLIATGGLLLVYPLFAAIHSIFTDGATTLSEVAETVLVVPVFALFSAPVAWPITLVFACVWHRLLQRRSIEGQT